MLAEMGVTLRPDPTMVDRGGVTQGSLAVLSVGSER